MIRRLIRGAAKFLSSVPAQTDKVKVFPADWLLRQISIPEAEDHEGMRGMKGWNSVARSCNVPAIDGVATGTSPEYVSGAVAFVEAISMLVVAWGDRPATPKNDHGYGDGRCARCSQIIAWGRAACSRRRLGGGVDQGLAERQTGLYSQSRSSPTTQNSVPQPMPIMPVSVAIE